MPVIKQAIKKVRQDKRKTQINARKKVAYKKAVSEFRKSPTDANLKIAYIALDSAAKTNVIHKNKAARLKSRLSKKVGSKGQISKTSGAKRKKKAK